MNPSAADTEALFVTAERLCALYDLTLPTLRRLTHSWNHPAYVQITPRIVRYDLAAFDEWFRGYSVGTAHKTETAQPVATLAEGSASSSSCEEAAEAM